MRHNVEIHGIEQKVAKLKESNGPLKTFVPNRLQLGLAKESRDRQHRSYERPSSSKTQLIEAMDKLAGLFMRGDPAATVRSTITHEVNLA